MSEALPFTVKPVYWTASQQALKQIRTTVFVMEQGVPMELEWDGLDEHAYHVMGFAPDGTPIGTGRLLRDGRIGRMAVLKEWRGRGVGRAMLDLLVAIAGERGHDEVTLHAQIRALDFYRRGGFTPQGKAFMEAGIPHIAMSRTAAGQAP